MMVYECNREPLKQLQSVIEIKELVEKAEAEAGVRPNKAAEIDLFLQADHLDHDERLAFQTKLLSTLRNLKVPRAYVDAPGRPVYAWSNFIEQVANPHNEGRFYADLSSLNEVGSLLRAALPNYYIKASATLLDCAIRGIEEEAKDG